MDIRKGVINQLRQHLNAVVSKRPGQAVGLWGEPGVGKTFTVQALLRETPCKSLSLHATVSDHGLVLSLPRPPKRPLWTEALRERLTQGQHLETQALLDTLAATLAALAPFVVHLEDIHEASPERLELIQKLARLISRLRGVGLLVTSRSEPPEPFKAYRLEPLDQATLAELLQAQARGTLPREALAWVFARTQGNPLFSLEFWRYLSRQGFLWSDGQDWHWRAPDKDFVPASIEGLIAQIIANSADQASQRVLEARAIFPVNPEALEPLWAEVAGVETHTLSEARNDLQARGVLVGDRFVHPLFHEVVRRETPPERRQTYARRAIAILGPSQPEQAAEFLGSADLPGEQAIGLLEQAAAAAAQRGDEPARAKWLAEMVQWSPGEDRAKRALSAAQALISPYSNQALEMAEIAASAVPPDPEAVFLLAELLAIQGYVAEAEARLNRLPWSEKVALRWWETQIGVAVRGAQWSRAVELWNLQAHLQALAKPRTCIMVARSHVSMQQLGLAQQMLETLPDFESLEPATQMMLLNVQGQIHSYTGNHRAALETGERLIALTRSLGSPLNTVRALLNHATDCKALGLYQQINPTLEEAKHLATQLGDVMMYAVVLLRLADEQIDTGDFEKAETLLLEGQHLLQRHNTLHFLSECQNKLARLYLRWQPPYGTPLALKHAKAALGYARQNQDAQQIASALTYLARAECLAGNPRQALEVAQEGLEFCQQKNTKLADAWFAYGLALERSGKKSEAREAIERAYTLQKEPLVAELFAIELDRLDNNLERARARYEGLVSRGLLGLAQGVLRYFPQLGQERSPERAAQPTTLRLKVLGSVELEQSGQPLRIRARKRLEVLCYLLEARIAGRAEVDVLELVDVFYPELPEERAKLTLRQLIYLIRGDLGAESVQSTPNGYALGAVGSDLEEFLESGKAGLWRRGYLHGLSDGWNANVRDGLELALRSSAEGLLDSDPAEAARLGQIWLEMEPYDPEALRLTLRAPQASGQPRSAASLYRRQRAQWLEVGETLPEALEDFLSTPTAS